MAPRERRHVSSPAAQLILEALFKLKMTQAQLAKCTSLSAKHVSDLMRSKVPITPDVALRVEAAIQVSAETLIALDASYRVELARGARDEVGAE